jgi:hypothetical protein
MLCFINLLRVAAFLLSAQRYGPFIKTEHEHGVYQDIMTTTTLLRQQWLLIEHHAVGLLPAVHAQMYAPLPQSLAGPCF